METNGVNVGRIKPPVIFELKQDSRWKMSHALTKSVSNPYLVKELEKSPMKAMAAPEAAVVLHPIRSVKMLTMGEQKKLIPMPSDPTPAVEGKANKHWSNFPASQTPTTVKWR